LFETIIVSSLNNKKRPWGKRHGLHIKKAMGLLHPWLLLFSKQIIARVRVSKVKIKTEEWCEFVHNV